MTRSQWLIHAAADTGHGHGTSEQARVNLDGTRNVFETARSAGVRRALIISTESVLLDGRPLVGAGEGHPLPRRPAGSYSRTKAAAERLALSLAGPEFEVVAIRPRFVWGRDDTTALPNLLSAARSGRMAWIDGGRYRTSTGHIANLCEGVARALERGRNGEVYFIADEVPVMFRDFVSQLLATQGVNPPTKNVPRWVLRSLAEVTDIAAKISLGRITGPLSRQEYATMAVEVTVSTAKARKELGYRPVISIEDGYGRTGGYARTPASPG